LSDNFHAVNRTFAELAEANGLRVHLPAAEAEEDCDLDPCCDPAAVEVYMLQAEITGLCRQQRALGRWLETLRHRDRRQYKRRSVIISRWKSP
jgi:hypothetical protein